jgi:hypothetical protein
MGATMVEVHVIMMLARMDVLLIIGVVGVAVILVLMELQVQRENLLLLQLGMLTVPQLMDLFYPFLLLVYLLF